MQIYGTLDTLLEYAPQQEPHYSIQYSPNPDKEPGSLEDLLQEKVRCLSDILTQIKRDIKSREDLSNYVRYLISKHYCYLKTKLYELDTWALGRNRSIEIRRIRLEQQLDRLNQETRKEQVQCWQDVELLKKEFRTWFKHYCDLVQRVRLILPAEVATIHKSKSPGNTQASGR